MIQRHETTAVGRTPALELDGVRFAYPGQRVPALEGVSLRVEPGERLGILGPNGGGKSTLLKLCLGLLEGQTGAIAVFGLAPDEARRRQFVGYVPQRIEATLAWPISARQAVLLGPAASIRPWRPVPRDVADRADRALELVGASDFAGAAVGKLSGGQLQRVMIARALAIEPRMLVLDEPMVGIDLAGQKRFAALIERLHQELELTIVTVSHDLRTVASGSDRVACLRRGLHYHAAPGGLTPEILAEVFAHDVEDVFGAVHVEAHRAEDCDDPRHARDRHAHHDHDRDHDDDGATP